MQTALQTTTPTAGEDLPLLEGLTGEQRQVVLAQPGPLLVLAGAGSGKTRTLTHRVAWLLRPQPGARPARVLLMTFTQAAAAEMMQRTARLLGHELRAARQLSPRAQGEPVVWAGTFHHIAARCLRCHGARLGLAEDFAVLAPTEALQLLRQGARDAALTPAGRAALGPLLRRPERLLGLFSRAVNSEATLAEVVAARAPDLSEHTALLMALCDAYARRKLALRRVDFDDLLLLWRLLLCDVPEAAAALQESFDHVLVDEYQDVSPLQAAIVRGLCAQHGSLMAVGDPAQAIYGFRGADSAQLARFPTDHPGARVLRLTLNHRSLPQVVALANRVMARGGGPALVLRPAVPPLAGAEPPQLIQVADEAAQATWVAQRARALCEGGRSPGELAVLYRNHAHGRALPAALQAEGLPYVVRAGRPAAGEGALRDEVLWHLRLLVDPGDLLARERLSGLYHHGGAALQLTAQLTLLRERQEGWDRGPTGGAAGLLGRLLEGLQRGPYGALRPGSEVALRALTAELSASLEDPAGGALWTPSHGVLRELLLDAVLATEEQAAPQGITLATVHRAKGLEWGVVFVLGLCEGYFPSLRPGSDMQEERHLFYVAVTRARQGLYLLAPKAGASGSPLTPSRYLRDLRAP